MWACADDFWSDDVTCNSAGRDSATCWFYLDLHEQQCLPGEKVQWADLLLIYVKRGAYMKRKYNVLIVFGFIRKEGVTCREMRKMLIVFDTYIKKGVYTHSIIISAFWKCVELTIIWRESATSSCISRYHLHVQPIAFGVSFNLNLQSQSNWSLLNGTWQKRPRELDSRLGFEIEEMTLQMHSVVYLYTHVARSVCIIMSTLH